jgi:hypothetical protein
MSPLSLSSGLVWSKSDALILRNLLFLDCALFGSFYKIMTHFSWENFDGNSAFLNTIGKSERMGI